MVQGWRSPCGKMVYVPNCNIVVTEFKLWSVVWFYGISTIVGYLMPNPLYTYIGFGFVEF